ncbi:very short patch repair endonuclease [Methylobacterium sp. CM6247]
MTKPLLINPPTPARTALMKKVRQRDTKPEIVVRRVAHALGFRFRLHRRDLPGSPDLVLPRHKVAVFVHGCFWHRHPGCRSASTPKANAEFWSDKFDRNVERDARKERELRALGWRVLIIWECDTRDAARVAERLSEFICNAHGS